MNKKLVGLLVVVVGVLIGLIYSIERTARPISDRRGTVASGGESPAPGPAAGPMGPGGPMAPAAAGNAPAGDAHAGHDHSGHGH